MTSRPHLLPGFTGLAALTSLTVATLALAACAAPPLRAPSDLPAALAVPPGEQPMLEAPAVGVQIYTCEAASPAGATRNDASPGTWKFKAPEATLADASGKPLGKHDAGPTWESPDGSAVVGTLRASDPGPDAGAIPWLALTAKSTRGNGVFTPTTSVLRVRTAGGIAPTRPCGAANANEVARVPYTATYYFYSRSN